MPQIFADLTTQPDLQFVALQPHQEHPWYAFLVQLAAIALQRASVRDLPESEDIWREILIGLTEGEEAWTLAVDDDDKPAFLQAPLPDGRQGLRNRARFPDEIDLLVSAKNHDLKVERIPNARPEHWVYALVSLQTAQGFLGAGNYGIARMNGGFGNRPCVAFRPKGGIGTRFIRDVKTLLETRRNVVDRFGYADDGVALVWLEPWDGRSQISVEALDPYFVEICRRVRLEDTEGKLIARYGGSRKARIDDGGRNGDLGDPWTPVEKTKQKSLTVSSSGFRYDLTQALLLSAQYEPGLALRKKDDDESIEFYAWALARGQGKTDGIHERVLGVPHRIVRLLAFKPSHENLENRSQLQLKDVDHFTKKVLKPALLTLIQGGPDKLNFKDARARDYLDAFDARVDDHFFVHLWKHAEDSTVEEATVAWQRILREEGWRILQRAIDASPFPSTRRYRAIARAERTFDGAWFNHFLDAAASSSPEDD